MPTARIHVHEHRYDEQRLARLGDAIQGAQQAVLKVPPEHYYRRTREAALLRLVGNEPLS